MKVTTHRPPQPGSFAFTDENLTLARKVIARYPEGRQASAVIALLDLAQRQGDGWLPDAAVEYVAELLDMAPVRVYEVASFYTMLYRRPVGRHLIQVCRTTPCWLRGSDGLTAACLEKLKVGLGQRTEDGLFEVVEVECLGACANAPMAQINDDYYEDLTPERLEQIIDALRAGEAVPRGSQSGRQGSMPEGERTTLLETGPGGGPGAGPSGGEA